MSRNSLARTAAPIMVGREATQQELQVVAARREAENGLVIHQLHRHLDQEMSRIDAAATSAAVKATLDTELEVLQYGIGKTNGSAAAAKLVADRVEQLSRINTQNINRRFGA